MLREQFSPEVIYGLTTIPTEFPSRLLFLKESDKLTLKYVWKFRTPRVAKHNFEENKTDFKFPYTATVIRMGVLAWAGRTDPCSRIRIPEIHLYVYGQ